MEKIGIYGGSFDPVHLEHVRLALLAVEKLGLSKLIVMPTFVAPHKSNSSASAKDRFNMLKLAFADHPQITVSDYEITKGGTSYTYLTVEHFKKQFDGQLFFITGADMLKDFKTWKYPQRILENCTLACYGRKNADCDFESEKEYFYNTYKKDFVKIDYQGQNVSSTKARVYASLGLDITNISGSAVAEYVKQNNLYCGDQYADFVKKTLPQKRLIHTANVTLAGLIKCKSLGLDAKKVQTACLLHDCAKYIDHTTVQGFSIPPDVPKPVIHSFLGAYIAQTVLKIDDQEIIDAIKYHTSGKPQMSTLAKLVFVADMIEDGRDYQGVEQLRQAFYHQPFEQCFKMCLQEEVLHLLNKKEYIYGLTLDAYDYYVKGENK